MTDPTHSSTRRDLVLSYLGLRRAIGWIGLLLPFVLALGAAVLRDAFAHPTISSYYYGVMSGVLVGSVCAIGVFLMSYRGHERKDDVAGSIGGLAAVGLALFPVAPNVDPTTAQKVVGAFHFVFATIFFVTLAFFCICLFTKTHKGAKPAGRKLTRNRIYIACGWVMLGCIVLIGVCHLPAVARTRLDDLRPVYWLEAIAIVAFGVSWLIKGETLFRDRKNR